ncbi:MAG: xanthine dehydrogenase family protein molybdopterin-binding subunit, partial [bacterium]
MRSPRESIEWSVVGHDLPRLDGPEKVRGSLRYLADMDFPGALHCVLARSERPHAKILRMETEAARALPGVAAVVTGEDLLAIEGVTPYYGPAFRDQPILAIGKVRYAGEPIAAVAAESREAAEEAAALISAEYEDLPYEMDPYAAAQPGAPAVHDRVEAAGAFADLMALQGTPGSNVCTNYKLRCGDAERALAEADTVFEDTYVCPPVSHAHLEPHGTVARFEPGGRLVVHTTSQSPFFVRADLAAIFGLPLAKVRVVVPPLGGSYGGKIYDKLEPVTCLMAKVTGREVRCHLTREEVFFTTSRHGAVTKIWTGLKGGRITARKMEVYYDTGAYAEIGPRIAQKTGSTAPGPYKIPNVQVDVFCVYTNKTPSGPLRGFGVPQLSIAYETHMDKAAAHLGRDPVDLRREYVLEEGDLYATGSAMTSIGLKPCLEAVAEDMAWPAGGRVPPRREREGAIARGRGIALGIKSVLSPSISNAIVELSSDGSAIVRCATVEMGQGSTTIFAQMAAEVLGLSPEKVRVPAPDTDQSPYDTLTAGSRSTYHMGNAVVEAARRVREKLIETAAEDLEIPAGDLELREGRVFVRSLPERGLTIPEIFIKRFGAPGTTLTGEGTFQTRVDKADPETGQTAKMTEHWFAGATGAEVEVDTETGFVTVTRLYGAGDVGRAINPQHCAEQIRGAAIMTLGFTLFEEMRMEDGRLTNGTFLEYPLPGFRDVPR